MNICVGNLAFTTIDQDLHELFEAYGTVDTVQIMTDRETGQSSRAQARTTVGQYGFKPRCLPAQPYPARSRREVKHHVRIPPDLQRFERAFVVTRVPSCSLVGMINPTSRSPVSTTPTDFPGLLVLPRVCARRPGLGYLRDLPCFGATLLPSVPSPLRREEEQRHLSYVPAPRGFPQHNSASASPATPHQFPLWKHTFPPQIIQVLLPIGRRMVRAAFSGTRWCQLL
jgi:RNA recognition motif-containing protein